MHDEERGRGAPISSQDLRAAFGKFATGVTVMTAITAEGERLGATVSSFNSVSLDPPLILFSLARTARAFDHWAKVDGFAVNILAEDQTDISNRFAKSMSDKWAGIATSRGPALGLPLIQGALAMFECATHGRFDGGDHLIIVGEILSVRSSENARRPLLFYGSRYRSLDTQHTIATPDDAEVWLHGW